MDKQTRNKGLVLVLGLLAMGLAFPFMMGDQSTHYFLVKFPNGREILAQVAETPEKQVVGLFFTEELPPGRGMLLAYREEDSHLTWTKNIHFPVDLIWLDRDRRVIHVEENVPPCKSDPCPAYGPEEPIALYVLQTAPGVARDNDLLPGADLSFKLFLPEG